MPLSHDFAQSTVPLMGHTPNANISMISGSQSSRSTVLWMVASIAALMGFSLVHTMAHGQLWAGAHGGVSVTTVPGHAVQLAAGTHRGWSLSHQDKDTLLPAHPSHPHSAQPLGINTESGMMSVSSTLLAAVTLFGATLCAVKWWVARECAITRRPTSWAMTGVTGSYFGHHRPSSDSARVPLGPRYTLGGEYEERYDDVELYLMHFLTYKALRFVLHDLAEKDEGETDYEWLYKFMTTHTSVAVDSEKFLKELASERPDLAVAVSDMRLEIFTEWMKNYDQLSLYERIKASNLNVMKHQLYKTVILPGSDRNGTEA